MSGLNVKKTVSTFSYRTEPKPGGGFIARPSDPAMETLEGATEQEVQQKVLGAITASLTQNTLLGTHLLGNVKVTKTRVKLDDKTGAALKLDPSLLLADDNSTADAPTPIQFERSKWSWPAIIVIVATALILYGILRR